MGTRKSKSKLRSLAPLKVSGAASTVRPDDFLIEEAPRRKVFAPVVDGHVKGHGYESRDFAKHPRAMFDSPSTLKLIPRSEWDDRINEQEVRQASLEHVRNAGGPGGGRIPSLDQDGQGYCWAYSPASAMMLARARDNQEYVRLSGHAVACKIKNFRDQGGWCGESAAFAEENGYPSIGVWPEKSMERKYDRPETWADAKRHRIVEDYVDLTAPVYGRNLSFDAIATCLLLNIPVSVDYDEWSHSICAIKLVRVEAGSYTLMIWNQWTDGWGKFGTGLIDRRWTVDGAVAQRAVTASAA